MSYNCPICNKAGLPDYRNEIAVCSQCNSDLKAFLLLHSISEPKKLKTGKYLLVGVALLSIAFLGLFLKFNFDKNELIAKNVILNDSISRIQNINVEIKEEIEPLPMVEKQDATIKYVVKKGDYPYKIAQFFYNDGSKYKKIEADNNLEQPYILKAGQILTVTISLE